MAVIAEHGWKSQKIVRIYLKWLNIAEKGCKCLAVNCFKWLELAGMTGNWLELL